MAHIPAVQLSTRTLRNLPDTYVAQGYRSNVGPQMEHLAETAGRVAVGFVHDYARGTRHAQREAERRAAAAERMANHEADIVAAEWEDGIRKTTYGWNEVGEDGKPVEHKGIVHKGWTDYEGTDGSPIKDLAEAERRFQTENEHYKALSPAARQRFDEKVMLRRQQYLEHVNQFYERNRAEKMKYEKGVKDQNDIDRVQLTIGASNEQYAITSQDAAIRMTVREMEPLITNPDAIDYADFNPEMLEFKNGDAGKRQFYSAVKERLFGDKGFAAARITYLTQKAGNGESVNGLSPTQALDAADSWIGFLEGKGPDGKVIEGRKVDITSRQAENLREVVKSARKKYLGIQHKEAHEWAIQTEGEMLASIPSPLEGDTQDAVRYHAQRAQGYKQICDSIQGQELAKHDPAKFKAFKAMSVSEAKAAVTGQRKLNGDRLLAVIQEGYIGDHEITPAEIQATATDLFNAGEITQDAYDKAMRAKHERLSPRAQALHDKIFAQKGAKFPELCKWQENLGRFVIPETKAGYKAKDQKLALVKEEHWYGDDKETLLYKQYVDAANYAIKYLETKNCTIEQAYAEFQALTLGTEKELAALSYDQRLARKQAALEAITRRSSDRRLSFARKALGK